jgi:hypothetical protein
MYQHITEEQNVRLEHLQAKQYFDLDIQYMTTLAFMKAVSSNLQAPLYR